MQWNSTLQKLAVIIVTLNLYKLFLKEVHNLNILQLTEFIIKFENFCWKLLTSKFVQYVYETLTHRMTLVEDHNDKLELFYIITYELNSNMNYN